jgi:plasmid stability protein
MASITIRKLDDGVKAKLRVRAAVNGRSMEEEAREILKAGLQVNNTHPKTAKAPQGNEPGRKWVEEIRALFEPLGGVDLDPYIPPRTEMLGRPRKRAK